MRRVPESVCVMFAVAIMVLAGGCSAGRHQAVAFEVRSATALADEAVHIRLVGVPAGKKVRLTAKATDHTGAAWQGEGRFTADRSGVVDLDRDPSTAGTYSGVDGMGLLATMVPADGRDPDTVSFYTEHPELAGSFPVELTAYEGDNAVTATTLHRVWTAGGVAARSYTVDKDKFVGESFLPAQPSAPNAVLTIGGSEGGISLKYEAALLASHGVPALSVGYFAVPGLPSTLHDIPLEYFRSAATRLHELTGKPIVVLGYSRGTEVALMMASAYPELVTAAVVYAPTSVVYAGYPGGGTAWTRAGKPIAAYTPLSVHGPVLAIAGGADRLWNSKVSARTLADAGAQSKIYPDAGHGVGTFPYRPTGVRPVNPVTQQMTYLGGSRTADEAARRDGWPRALAFIRAAGA